MIVLDTHAWYWWASGSPKLPANARSAIERAKDRGVSPVSCFELARLVARGQVRIDRPVRQWVNDALAQPGVHLLEVTADIALLAAAFGGDFPGDPLDRMIAATALTHDCPLVTGDGRIASDRRVETIW